MDQLNNFLSGILKYPIEQLPFVVITLLIAFTVHEFAHAYTAYKFGDPTAKDQGRLTLNPIQHLDPFGTILILIAGFGWARPVPVNRRHFKNPRAAGILVSIMGPLSNLLLAFIGYGVFYFLISSGSWTNASSFIMDFLNIFVQLNMMLFVFNLIPLPPLDGYRIVEDLVSPTVRAKMTQFEQYSILVFLIIIVTPLDEYTIFPLMQKVSNFFLSSFQTIFSMFM
ncbi:site-2 protease family protein [Heyndrickxia sporothermodurans]|uniref:site-2 protease family protein n=1 Tax=Heyndrickxia sporothermodurans TaxID=46224 RepID=UPI000D3C2DD5|nr:site-2 protease family protein [Heyndrickxia sporothermodurans]PTY78122.1 site-2 protease family protein [Heyndrickxia sporothermodurans]